MQAKVKRSFFTTVDHPFHLERLEPVLCDFCGNGEYRLVTTELGFEVRKCRSCGLVYVSPQPVHDELDTFYEAMSTESAPEQVETRSLGLYEKHLRRIISRRMPQGGRLLDAGCGFGMFLKHMADSNWELSGIELSETAANHAEAIVPGATIIRGMIEKAPIPSGSQDCVTAAAVLEHMKSPRQAIGRFVEWLAPGGLLVLQVPYITPFLKVHRWAPLAPLYFEAPHHLYDISPRCMRRYLAEFGLESIEFEIAAPYSSPSPVATAAIQSVKLVGKLLYVLSGRQYIYPFAGAYVVHATKGESTKYEGAGLHGAERALQPSSAARDPGSRLRPE